MQVPAKKKILFIDDEESVLYSMSKILSLLGFNVVAMQSSTEALASFRKEPTHFDIVVTDHNMPQLTGYDMAKQFLEIRPDIPIILYTACSSEFTPEKVKKTGIKELLIKPVSAQELAGVINRILEPVQCKTV